MKTEYIFSACYSRMNNKIENHCWTLRERKNFLSTTFFENFSITVSLLFLSFLV